MRPGRDDDKALERATEELEIGQLSGINRYVLAQLQNCETVLLPVRGFGCGRVKNSVLA